MRVSVLTPTYNRSDKLIRLYNSLEKSTYRDFEWIIVNDGSTDDTDQIIKEIVAMASFPITYIYQENSGKHIAMNRLYDLAKGEYCFQIDDDDEILPDAMEKGLSIWDGMSDEQRSNCWCVCGRHKLFKTQDMFGDPFPHDINEMPARKRKKVLASLDGDKCGMQKVSLVKQYKLPELEGCSFFPEIYLWRQLDAKYKQFYVNEFFGLCHSQTGEGLMNFVQNKSSFEKRFKIYEYLLSYECVCKSKFLSKMHLTELYCFNYLAEKAEIKSVDRYKRITPVNRVLVLLLKIPSLIYKKLKH